VFESACCMHPLPTPQGAALAALAYTPLSGASATGGFLALPPASMQAPMSLPVAAGLHGSGGGNAASAPQPAPVDSKQQVSRPPSQRACSPGSCSQNLYMVLQMRHVD